MDNGNAEFTNETPGFEVESIELATPELFSEEGEVNSLNHKNNNEKEPEIFGSSNDNQEKGNETIKEPEMFEETNSEEDFEIPAFLRKQKF